MNTTALILLVLAALVAAVDWFAVARERQGLEYLAKPGTMVVLIGATLALDPVSSTQRGWFVAALVLSMLGDIFLMLPSDRFVPGLASFLLGHIAYIVGLWTVDVSGTGLALGGAFVAVALVALGTRIVTALRRGDEPELLAPVVVYIAVITAMVVSAAGSANVVAVLGAISFYVSDALIAWNRFIREYPWGRLAIIVTYHAAQIALVGSLVV